MTDFSSTVTPSQTPNDQTTFNSDGAPGNQTQGPADNAVVLEYGGRTFTKADLLKKLSNADQHVNTLTTELADQRTLLNEVNETLKRQVSAAELLQKVKDANQPTRQELAPNPPAAPDPKAFAQQVQQELAANAAATAQEANWTEVTTKLTGLYGDKVNQKVQEVATENGMSLSQAAQLARTAPKAFLRLFPDAGKVQPKGSDIGRGSAVNPLSLNAAPKGPSGFAQAKNLKESISIYHNRLRELGL